MSGKPGDRQLTLMIGRETAKPIRAVFGYVAFTVEKEGQAGASSPMCAEIVLKAPFRYAIRYFPVGKEDSFAFCRLDACASKARLPVSPHPIGIESVAHGAIEKSHSEHDAAQLAPGGAPRRLTFPFSFQFSC